MAPDRDRLSVAFVIDKFPPFIGGAECQARLLAHLLSMRLGHCDVFTAQPDAQCEAPVRLRRLGTHHGGRALRHPLNFAVACREFLAHGHRYSVVHGHALSGLACGAIVGAGLRGGATLVKVCSMGPEGDIAKITRHPFGRWLWPVVRRLSTFVVPTPALVPELVAAGVALGRVAVIPNAISDDIPEPAAVGSKARARAELGLPDRPTVLFVGRLSHEKGPDVLMRAWDKAAPECEATLVVVGTGPESQRMADWAGRSRHADRIRLVGPRSDVDRFYQAADVLVVPSRTETFGNVLAEAMAHGLVVVSTPVGLTLHWMRNWESGLIVRGEDGGEMAAALTRLAGDAPLRARLGGAARRVAVTGFSADLVVAQYRALYEQLCATAVLPVGA